MDEWAHVESARRELAEDLEPLEEGEWDKPSLCREWRVRDVVAHLLDVTEVHVGAFVVGAVRNGFSPDRYLAREGRRGGACSPSVLVERLRACAPSRARLPFTRPITILVDATVHGQDIRRPLGLRRPVPEERLRLVLDGLKTFGFPMNARKRAAGLTLRTTDMDWSHGRGPEVEGPGEAIAMLLAGRPAALTDLKGPGLAVLSGRL
jgi:uncharacterized protein (TIGR03083 family)